MPYVMKTPDGYTKLIERITRSKNRVFYDVPDHDNVRVSCVRLTTKTTIAPNNWIGVHAYDYETHHIDIELWIGKRFDSTLKTLVTDEGWNTINGVPVHMREWMKWAIKEAEEEMSLRGVATK